MAEVPTDETISKILEVLKEHERRISELEQGLHEPKAIESKAPDQTDIVQTVLSYPLETEQLAYMHKLNGLPLFLAALDLVTKKFRIDSLSPTEISAILEGKFSVKPERSNISHTLSSAIPKGLVDRVINSRGSGYLYRITPAGFDYLNKEIAKIAGAGSEKTEAPQVKE